MLQPAKWKSIFTNYASDRILGSRICKELNKQPNKKLGIGLNIEFSKDETQITKKYFKIRSTPLAIREMLITTTLRFYLTTVSIININKINDRRCQKRLEKCRH